MEYINVHSTTLRSEAFSDASKAQRGVWLTLMAFCAAQENGGRIRNCRGWDDRKWIRQADVTLEEIQEPCALWSFKVNDDDTQDLIVEFYPKDKEAMVRHNRRIGKVGGNAKAAKRNERQVVASGVASGVASARADAPTERKGKEGNGIEGRDRSSSLEPGFDQSETEPIGAEIPTDDDVIAFAREYRDLARGITSGIPEAYALNWLAFRCSPKAGPFPHPWRDDLRRRFTAAWIEHYPSALAAGPEGAQKKNAAKNGASAAQQIFAIDRELVEVEGRLHDAHELNQPGDPADRRRVEELKKMRRDLE
jgi:hypothetical protein